MILFSQEIYKLINTALTELNGREATGRIQHNALSEAHYLGAWVTTAIKQKRFDAILLPTLKIWQRQARSLGKNSGLKEQFTYLKTCYEKILSADGDIQPVNVEQFTKLYSSLNDVDWLVTTDLAVGDKLNRLSGGKDSLIVCAQQINDNFDEQGVLIEPISLYVRGNVQIITDLAFENNLLLHKITDYKSKVKYHGEYIIYPHNDGTALPEFPTEKAE